jgi:hypothetical protein
MQKGVLIILALHGDGIELRVLEGPGHDLKGKAALVHACRRAYSLADVVLEPGGVSTEMAVRTASSTRTAGCSTR